VRRNLGNISCPDDRCLSLAQNFFPYIIMIFQLCLIGRIERYVQKANKLVRYKIFVIIPSVHAEVTINLVNLDH
jgi:hypothetical protein